jgi:hypothetical protein
MGERPERRAARRANTLSALDELLDAVRRNSDFRALAVADSAGVLVAGSGAFAECEELAAWAPLAARQAANDDPWKSQKGDDPWKSQKGDTVPTRLDVVARKMLVRRLTIDGIEVLLCGHGGQSDALRRAAVGCARILGQRRHPS